MVGQGGYGGQVDIHGERAGVDLVPFGIGEETIKILYHQPVGNSGRVFFWYGQIVVKFFFGIGKHGSFHSQTFHAQHLHDSIHVNVAAVLLQEIVQFYHTLVFCLSKNLLHFGPFLVIRHPPDWHFLEKRLVVGNDEGAGIEIGPVAHGVLHKVCAFLFANAILGIFLYVLGQLLVYLQAVLLHEEEVLNDAYFFVKVLCVCGNSILWVER